MLKPAITFVIHQSGRAVRRETVRRGVIRIGSDPRGHVHLDDPAVAKRHAVIELVGPERVTLVALAGESGVRLNGEWVEESPLRPGDRIEIGGSVLLVEEVVRSATPAVPEQVRRVVDELEQNEPTLAFAAETNVPFAANARVPKSAVPAFVYALLARGPALGPDEVELPHLTVAEVQVSWGDNVLFITHLGLSETFNVGDEQSPSAPCDFLIPREKLGAARLPLLVGDGANFWLIIPPQATGHVQAIDGTRHALDVARASGQPSVELPRGHKLRLSLGTRAQLEFGDIVIQIAAVRAGKPMPHGLRSDWDTSVLTYLGLSALSVGGLLSSMALLVPPLGLLSDEDTDADRLYLLQQYLSSAAERERLQPPGDTPAETPKSAAAGGQASGESGAMGKPEAEQTNRRYAVRGTAPRNEQQLSRHETLHEATEFGMIGLLNSGLVGDPNAPTAPWGADFAVGSDEQSARGDMWSDAIGDVRGPGGLGPSGTGIGGGGDYEGIGMGPINTIGGLGKDKDGWGMQHGQTTGTHRTSTPRLRMGDSRISGKLPAETVRRIVRQNHPRFRHCYEKGLMTNPSLEGRVNVRFVIGRDGAVTNVSNAGSDLPDPTVVSCVARAFYDIGFPKPEGGIVTVVYPIALQAD